MSKHTPGPWAAVTSTTSAGLCHVIIAHGWRGAFIYGDGIRPGIDDALPKAQELAANARLIAAAPELLEALQAVKRLDYVQEHDWIAGKVDAAIAKATGEA